jgi:hypothetical protein
MVEKESREVAHHVKLDPARPPTQTPGRRTTRARADGWQPELRSWVRDNYANMFAFVAANPDSFPVLREAERAGDLALTRLRGRLAQVYTEASRQRWAAHGVEPGRADRAPCTSR